VATVSLNISSDRSPGTATRTVAVVGGGLAGLSAATMLAQDGRWNICLYEREAMFGGRAAEDPERGEHCPRLLLSDYDATRDLLGGIPGDGGAQSILDTVVRVRRMEWIPSRGWIELDHINRFRASQIGLRDHVEVLRHARRHRPLVAARVAEPSRNRFGRWRQYSLSSLARIVGSAWSADRIWGFPGSTDRFLIAPMVANLAANGVELRPAHRVESLGFGDAADAADAADARRFDAVILALFPSDLAALLTAGGVGHPLTKPLRHAHCKVLTIAIDRRESVLRYDGPGLYCRGGLAVLVQPAQARCVVLCTRVASTDDDHLTDLVREFLSLEHPFGRVLTRDNQRPHEAVWSATMPKPSTILRRPGVHLAGSWLASGYPYDAAESAVRSARRAVEALRRELR
jgi:glycine/D-amino acid oxidase-like deaminating enzyme